MRIGLAQGFESLLGQLANHGKRFVELADRRAGDPAAAIELVQ